LGDQRGERKISKLSVAQVLIDLNKGHITCWITVGGHFDYSGDFIMFSCKRGEYIRGKMFLINYAIKMPL
jgi:hypothetical protein